jgi:hypothetical protein
MAKQVADRPRIMAAYVFTKFCRNYFVVIFLVHREGTDFGSEFPDDLTHPAGIRLFAYPCSNWRNRISGFWQQTRMYVNLRIHTSVAAQPTHVEARESVRLE